MIPSSIRLYILLFKQNDPKPKVLLQKDTDSVPRTEIVDMKPIGDSIKDICNQLGLSYRDDLFKISDCQLHNSNIEICYYCLLPFGYSNPLLNFVELSDIDLSPFPHLQKIINLL
jgi:hypothetical protein